MYVSMYVYAPDQRMKSHLAYLPTYLPEEVMGIPRIRSIGGGLDHPCPPLRHPRATYIHTYIHDDDEQEQ